MLNNNQSVRTVNNITLSSVSGTLVKTHDKSKFAKMTIDSPRAGFYLDPDRPTRPLDNGGYSKKPIEVLQVMLCGDGWLLVEFIDVE